TYMLSRRDFLSSASAAAVTSTAAQTGSAAYAQTRRPNFIIFVADDLGCHDIGAWGATDLKTPNIDALAASGARFTNWYAAAPVCAPSRSAVMTGRYPIRAGVPSNGPALNASERTIASLLTPAGYATCFFST